MLIDLNTLYVLLIGTLGVSAGLTIWERRFQPLRKAELKIWFLGYLAMGLGAVLLVFPMLDHLIQRSAGTLLMQGGYGSMLYGVLRFEGRRPPKEGKLWLIGVPLAMVAFFLLTRIDYTIWHVQGGLTIFALCGATGWTIARSAQHADLRSRKPAAAVYLFHGVFYLLRTILFLSFDPVLHPEFFQTLAKVTMVEGVLFAVAAPMLLLALVREESEARILATSETDYLTGLANRRALVNRSRRRLAEARAKREAVTVLVFDLDHFKRVNDTHGHNVGDEVLRIFARIAERELREEDFLARFGGEEFVAIAIGRPQECVREEALAVARSFAREAADLDGLAVGATVSVGVAHSGDGQDELPQLLSRADAALYQAKILGRNRVEQAPMRIAA